MCVNYTPFKNEKNKSLKLDFLYASTKEKLFLKRILFTVATKNYKVPKDLTKVIQKLNGASYKILLKDKDDLHR